MELMHVMFTCHDVCINIVLLPFFGYPNLSEGAASIGRQLHKEGVTNSGSLYEGARKQDL